MLEHVPARYRPLNATATFMGIHISGLRGLTLTRYRYSNIDMALRCSPGSTSLGSGKR